MSQLEPIENFHLQLIGVLGHNRFFDLFCMGRLGKMQKKSIFKLRLAILTIANAMTAGANCNC
jgi:hypothetical protein